MDMRTGSTENALSILRYDISVPVWSRSNLIAYRTPEDSWIRIMLPNDNQLVTLRCQHNLGDNDIDAIKDQLWEVNAVENYTGLSMVKPYGGNRMVRWNF